MEILRYESPFECSEALNLIESIFGKWERELEEPQLDGTEASFNRDIVFIAKEGNTPLGMIHLTIPKHFPILAGVSAVCTTEAARGKGIGRLLFKTATEELDSLGVSASILGTGNPIAAKLYSSFGFNYLSCTGVMLRLTEGGVVDFNRSLYGREYEKATASAGDAKMRIPMIPLVMQRGSTSLLDINTDLTSPTVFAQSCCMSLYRRYTDLRDNGGDFYQAFSENGVLLGISSATLDAVGKWRVDFFTADKCSAVAKELIMAAINEHPDAYFEFAESDTEKIAIAESLCYKFFAASTHKHSGVIIPTKKYVK